MQILLLCPQSNKTSTMVALFHRGGNQRIWPRALEKMADLSLGHRKMAITNLAFCAEQSVSTQSVSVLRMRTRSQNF